MTKTLDGFDRPDRSPSLSTNEEHLPNVSDDGFDPVSTVIFDVDDTLYDVSTGFTAHRNTDGATSFMVAKLGFPDIASAQALRDEYFETYHSTAKALTVAEAEGRLPPLPDPSTEVTVAKKPRFDPRDLSEWWAENLDYSILGGPDPDLVAMMGRLHSSGLRIVAFSNGPRLYVLRVLKEIGLEDFFHPNSIFAVDDVLPACKPEAEAFEKVFEAVGVSHARECVMVEDSMKNVRAAKALGMKTVLVAGKGRLSRDGRGRSCETGESRERTKESEMTKPGDTPVVDDPAVDVVVEFCSDMADAIPGLFRKPPTFVRRHDISGR